MSDKDLYIEEIIINSVKNLLTGAVNDYLAELEYPIGRIEFGTTLAGGYTAYHGILDAVCPEIKLSSGERSDKDRIIRLEVYVLTLIFHSPYRNGKRNSYAYAAAVDSALDDDPTLGGVVDRAVLIHKAYGEPLHSENGEDWEATLTIRIMVEKL